MDCWAGHDCVQRNLQLGWHDHRWWCVVHPLCLQQVRRSAWNHLNDHDSSRLGLVDLSSHLLQSPLRLVLPLLPSHTSHMVPIVESGASSYREVSEIALGSWAGVLNNIMLFLVAWTAIIAYAILMRDILPAVLAACEILDPVSFISPFLLFSHCSCC